jgi:hypothetical protein
VAGVEPPVDLGQVNAVTEADVPGHNRKRGSDDGKPGGGKGWGRFSVSRTAGILSPIK